MYIYLSILVSLQAPFPLRVTRVVTAVLPSSLVARRVSIEDPPLELHNPLREQVQPETLQRVAVQSKKMFNKPARRLLQESSDQIQSSAEMHQDEPVIKTNRQQRDQGVIRSSKESWSEVSRAETTVTSRNQTPDQAAVINGSVSLEVSTRKKSRTV